MEQMTIKQIALEKQITNLSIIVHGANKGFRKDNSGDSRNSIVDNNSQRDKNNMQMGGCMFHRYSKIEFPTYDGTGDPSGVANAL